MRVLIRLVVLAIVVPLAAVILAVGAAAAIVGLPLLFERLVARYTRPPQSH